MTAPLKHPIATTAVGAAVFALVVAQAGLVAPIGNEGQHSVSHLGPGIAAFLLVLASRVVWPPPADDAASRRARTAVVIGLGVFAVGQIVEAIGAFGYRGNARVSSLAALHDVGVVLGPMGLLVTLGGIVVSAGVAVARRRGGLSSRALAAALAAAVAVVATYVVAGIVLGF